MKLPPVTPMSADRKCGRSTSRASRVRSANVGQARRPCVSREEIGDLLLVLVHHRRDDVRRRLVVVDLQDVFAQIGLDDFARPSRRARRFSAHFLGHHRLALDHLLHAVLRAISATSRAASCRRSPRKARWRRAASLPSKVSSHTSRFSIARLRRSFSAARVASKSIARDRLGAGGDELRRELGQVLLQALVGQFLPARALNSIV